MIQTRTNRTNRAIFALLCLSVTALATACGGETSAPGYGTYAGVYTLDVDKTLAASSSGPGGLQGQAVVNPAVLAKLREIESKDLHRLELRADGSFTLRVGNGESTFLTQGHWSSSFDGIEMVTTSGDGAPVPSETRETAEIDGNHLVVHEGDRALYLRRL